MANEQNLKPPWPKGVSGNPKGRPKRPTFLTLLKELQDKNETEWQNADLQIVLDNPYHQALLQLLSAVQNGEPWAIKEFLDRGIGKPAQAIELTGADGGPIEHEYDIAEELRTFLDGASGKSGKGKKGPIHKLPPT